MPTVRRLTGLASRRRSYARRPRRASRLPRRNRKPRCRSGATGAATPPLDHPRAGAVCVASASAPPAPTAPPPAPVISVDRRAKKTGQPKRGWWGKQLLGDKSCRPTMKSAWVERDAKAAVDHYGKAGVGADLALRIYSTRLLGRDAKTGAAWRRQHFGEDQGCATSPARNWRCCCVKGSGWDMGIDRARRLAGRAARAAAQACARARRCPTKTWPACSAPF